MAVGRTTLDHVLSETDQLNVSIQEVLDHTAERWGVLVEMVELKDIELPGTMQRAMAKEAEAADVIQQHPVALQLRNLQVVAEIAAEKNSTILFPAQSMDTARAVQQFLEAEGSTVE